MQHQRIQERQVRHAQQPDTGTMEHHERKCAVQELDNPGEDRQVVRHTDGIECEGAQAVEQIGSGTTIARPGHPVRTIEQGHAGHVPSGGWVHGERARKLPGIHPIPGPRQQAIQADAQQVLGHKGNKGHERGQERRPSGVHTGVGIPVPDTQ
eukprot:300172-Heterocapsa_arctica.AAC.1